MNTEGGVTRHVVFAVALVLFALHLSWPLPAQAGHEAPQGNVPLPNPPAVFVFRGGTGTFTDNTQHWGGRAGYDAACEGLIRQALGLLNARGELDSVPAQRRISFGGSGGTALDAAKLIRVGGTGGRVIGFTNQAGTYRAINIDVSSFRDAFRIARAGETIYSCGLGTLADNGKRGGVILLDGGRPFNGFKSNPFPTGTNGRKDLTAYPDLPTPRGAVNVHLHHCFSAADPDGGAVEKFAVSATLGGAFLNVSVVHAHPGAARVSTRSSVEDGPAAVAATPAQLEAARTALKTRWEPVLGTLSFPQRYAHGQRMIDAAVPPAGTVALHLTYGDTGDAADPGGITQSGCQEVAGSPVGRGQMTIRDRSGAEAVPSVSVDSFFDVFFEVDVPQPPTFAPPPNFQPQQFEVKGKSKRRGQVKARVRPPHKAPFMPSTGSIQEPFQVEPGRLDVPPYCPECAGGTPLDSFFDVFFEVDIGGQSLHTQTPARLRGSLGSATLGVGDTFESGDILPLVDEDGNDSGLEFGLSSFTPRPPLSAVTGFTGTASRLGSTTDRAQIRIAGKFPFTDALNLGASTVTLETILHTGTGELIKAADGAAVLPIELTARAGSTANAAIYETASGVRPSFRMEIKNRNPGTGPLEVTLAIDAASIPSFPLCDTDPAAAELITSFTVDDDVNPPAVFSTAQDWRCQGTDPASPTKLRAP